MNDNKISSKLFKTHPSCCCFGDEELHHIIQTCNASTGAKDYLLFEGAIVQSGPITGGLAGGLPLSRSSFFFFVEPQLPVIN